jgi:hypothetical protein
MRKLRQNWENEQNLPCPNLKAVRFMARSEVYLFWTNTPKPFDSAAVKVAVGADMSALATDTFG